MIRGSIVALSLAALLWALPAAAQDAPIKVAIANPGRIFAELKETQQIEKRLREHGVEVQQKEREMTTNIKTLRDARDQIKKGTPEYEQRNSELRKAMIEYKTWVELTQAEVQQQNKEQTLALYEKIRAAVAEVARQKGVDLVIADQRIDLEQKYEKLTVEQLRSALTEQNILFANDNADLSADVIALMDAQFETAQK